MKLLKLILIQICHQRWNTSQLADKVKEFIHILQDLSSQHSGLNVDELKAFLHEQLRNAYDIKEAEIEKQRPGLMREAERFFILQQIDTLWRSISRLWMLFRISWSSWLWPEDPLIE